jgi:hyperosmotically inducible periplasmic protein
LNDKVLRGSNRHMKNIKSKLAAVLVVLAITAGAALANTGGAGDPKGFETQRVTKSIHKELATLPYYGVFDNLAYKVDGDTVTLYGHVVRPVTRSDAAARVASIRGVNHVINNIEVLPLSSFDDSIRARAYRSIFRTASLYRYAMGANPSLHIIVDRGHVTLEGVVSNKGDSTLAYMAANQVPGVFSVTNNLRLDRGNAH